MKETIIEKNSFDFEGFVDVVYKFLNDIYAIDPAILIQNVEKPCMTDKEAGKLLQNRSANDLLKELENGKNLYFPFTQAQITSDSDNIGSVDGTKYEVKNNLENLLSGYDTIGFIVSFEDSNFIFKSGIHKIITPENSAPSEEINEIKGNDYEQFYNPMESFLKNYIKN
ncbi:MAG: hypothetical protein JSU91_08690 [Thermoplasmatales archaeon]|nr:MAG: hypothetical protein JSU91_08690 [Thermoplasmatales archaeon]